MLMLKRNIECKLNRGGTENTKKDIRTNAKTLFHHGGMEDMEKDFFI